MPPELPPIRRVFGMQDSTAAALRFFASLIEQRASGTTRLITSVGVSLQMPHQVLKAPSIRAACLLYEEYCRNEAKQHALRNDPDEPPPPPPLSRGHVQYLLDLLVGSRRRQLAGAVDGIFCETVIDQSRNIKHLIGLVTEGRPKYGGKLLLLLRDVEEEYQRKEVRIQMIHTLSYLSFLTRSILLQLSSILLFHLGMPTHQRVIPVCSTFHCICS